MGRRRASSALALLPSAVGGLWAGHALWRLTDVFPRSLSGVPACDGTAAVGAAPGRRVLAGAIARLAVVTAVGSVAVVLALAPTVGAGVLAGLRRRRARRAAGRAARVARPARVGGARDRRRGRRELAVPVPFAGAALVAGGAAAVLLMVPAAFVLLARPARTLATALWIT